MTTGHERTVRRLHYLLPLLALHGDLSAALPLEGEEHLDCLIEPHQMVELGTPVPGVIDRILVERADSVAVGQALVELESSVEQATLRHAEERAGMDATIKAHGADLNLARQNLKRMEQLFERRVIPSQKRDEARAEYEVALRNYQVAKENQRLAQLELQTQQAKLARRIIRSPIDGVVVERMSTAGEFVDERPLLTLAQLDPLRVEVLIPAPLFGSIAPGMWAQVNPEIAISELPRARVVTVDRLVDSASGTFRVTLDLPNPDQRIPGGLKCGVRFLQHLADEPAAPAEQPRLPELAPAELESIASNDTLENDDIRLETPVVDETPLPEVAPSTAPAAPQITIPLLVATLEPLTQEQTADSAAALNGSNGLQASRTAEQPAEAAETSVTVSEPEAPKPAPSPQQAPQLADTKRETIDEPVAPKVEKIAVDLEQLAPTEKESRDAATAALPRTEQQERTERAPVPQETTAIRLAEPSSWCGTLSASSTNLRKALQPLRKAGIEVHEIHGHARAPRDFIVEMPAGEAGCSQSLATLRAAGFPDVACYTSKRTGVRMVSGGLFKQKEYALTRQQKFQAKGFAMELRTRYQKQGPQTLHLTAATRLQVLSAIAKIQPTPQLELHDTRCDGEKLAHR